ncbi:hypothetical protein FKN01_27525 [Streptomyces sp. 130]|uniref:hypothetical protein n=1 Tax=Streptomyces sp. 130 TaxID=2591006 RepID=UPI00118084AD|nr:hypothetical protein [Streptomyces sp. 130]TRV73326.1 hypothetical protein FKN01_27525 [Streptomyces sp. 130]
MPRVQDCQRWQQCPQHPCSGGSTVLKYVNAIIHPPPSNHKKSVGYFTYTIGYEKRIGVREVANKLLKKEIAETACLPGDTEVSLSPRFSDIARLMETVERWHSFSSAVRRGRRIRWAMRHVTHAVRHPRITLFADSGDLEESLARMNESSNMLTGAVVGVQFTNAVQSAVERDLYRPGYLHDEPYIRLHLRGVRVWLSILAGGEARSQSDNSNPQWVEVTALIHKSGVVQFTFAVDFPDNLTAEDFTKMQFGASPIIASVELPEAVLTQTKGWSDLALSLPGEWVHQVRAGTRWRRVFFPEAISLTEIFELYLEAFSSAASVGTGTDWMCHPCCFVEEIACCSDESTFRETHPEEFAYMVTRHRTQRRGGGRGDSMNSIMPPDTSLSMDCSVFMGGDKGLIVNWPGFGRSNGYASHLNHILVAESALLQFWQIREINWRIVNSTGSLRSIASVQEDAIFGLREYRESPLLYGTAVDVAKYLLEKWRADSLYGYAIESLDQLQQFVSTAESQRAANRANALAAAAVLATAVLGMPAIDETFTAITEIPDSGVAGWTAGPLKGIAESGSAGVWFAYLVLLSVVAIIAVMRQRRRVRRIKGKRRKKVGIVWPLGSLRVTLTDEEGNRRR